MSKIVMLQRDVPVWIKASWLEAHDEILPRIETFCNDRFGISWDYWNLAEKEIYSPTRMQLPYAIFFEHDEDATIFLLGFK